MLDASSQGAAVAANPRASAQEPISFSPNAWAPAVAGGPSSAKARVYRNVRCNVISILLVRFGDRGGHTSAGRARRFIVLVGGTRSGTSTANIGDATAHGTTQLPYFIRSLPRGSTTPSSSPSPKGCAPTTCRPPTHRSRRQPATLV